MASQYDGGGSQISTLNDTTMEHSLTLTTTYKYLALKQFHIYQELPLSLYLPIEEGKPQSKERGNLKRTIISVDEIDRFELISKPTEKWLAVVRAARDRLNNSNDAWEDYQQPLWFHEIRKDTTLFNDLKVKLGSKRVPYPCGW